MANVEPRAAAGNTQAQTKPLTARDAAIEFAMLPTVFAASVGAPSILTILQYVFVSDELVPALQWIVDGYERVMTVLGAIVEPLVQPAIDWLGAQFRLDLVLNPAWRPLFALSMLFAMAMTRHANRFRGFGFGLSVFLLFAPAALLASLAAGLLPDSAVWWRQGLQAGALVAIGILVPAFLVFVLMLVATVGSSILSPKNRPGLTKSLLEFPLVLLPTVFKAFALFFIVASVAALIPGARGASILALAGLVAIFGIQNTVHGIRQKDHNKISIGLNMLSGFALAGIILLADTLIRTAAPA